MKIIPLTLKEANDFVARYHRHHKSVVGHRFSIGLFDNDKIIGVAIVGRPVARKINQYNTAEVTRLCTDGTKNACSKLYSACARIAKEMGFEKIITYILDDEPGLSLKASGWDLEKECCGGKNWNVPSRIREVTNLFGDRKYPDKLKKMYSKTLQRGYRQNDN
jgi:hypothetical protein